jgi:hypothetical protein
MMFSSLSLSLSRSVCSSLLAAVHSFDDVLVFIIGDILHMASLSPTPWAYLEPIHPSYPRAIFTKTSYTIGRHPNDCDIVLDSKELRQHECFIHLSSKHFVIESFDNGRSVVFRDVSRNGCYIDGELIHQGKLVLVNSEHVM